MFNNLFLSESTHSAKANEKDPLNSGQKVPRLIAFSNGHEQLPLQGITFHWPDKSESAVFDISSSGILISPKGLVGRLKVGQEVVGRVRWSEQAWETNVRVRIFHLTASVLGFQYSSMLPEERMTIPQAIKDLLIRKNLRLANASGLHPSLKCDSWFHGPFDTNLLIWSQQNNEEHLKNFVLEFDGMILKSSESGFQFNRSHSIALPAEMYTAALLNPASGKITVSSAWLDRALALMNETLASAGLRSATLVPGQTETKGLDFK